MPIGRLRAAPALVVLALLAQTPAAAAAPEDAAAEGAEGTCLIKPRQVVQIGSPVAGLLSDVLVDRGDTVRRGQVIARIESSVEQADLALDRLKAANDTAIRAETAELAMAQRVLARKTYLVQQGEANASTLDEPQTKAREEALRLEEAQMEQRQAALAAERTERALELKQIRAPVDGVVTERKMSVGEYVYEQTPVMTVAEIDPLDVEVILPGARYGTIGIGITARVHPAPPLGGDYEARVDVIDPVIDAASNTFGVRLVLPNPGHRIPAGLRCDIDIFGAPATSGAKASR